MGVLGGIIAGIIAASMFNRFYRIKLPEYLGFFAGKRFVPIIFWSDCDFCRYSLSLFGLLLVLLFNVFLSGLRIKIQPLHLVLWCC